MSFHTGDRVVVTNQHSEFRNKLGEILIIDGADHHVRLDGFPTHSTKLMAAGDLRATTLPDPIDYSNAN